MNIDRVGTWLLQNIVLLAAVVVVPMKMVIIRFCGDKEGMALSFFAMPEDLCWVALGLVLGDVINGSGAFHRHYAYSNHVTVDICLVSAGGVAIAILVHRFGQFANTNFRSWRATQRAIKSMKSEAPTNQTELAIPNGESNFQLLMIRYLASFAFGYFMQFLLAGYLLYKVAKIISAT